MKKLHILIVDDEILIAEDLKDCLHSFGYAEVDMVHDKPDAIRAIDKGTYDLVLLDVRMKNEKDGIEIAEYISKTVLIPFIFITAHSDVAMVKEIIKTKPAGYITKPIKKTDLFASVSLIADEMQERSANALKIRDGYSTVLIHPENIIYVESEGNYLNIFCREKKYISRQSLDSLVAELNNPAFYRIHRSFLVNTSHITRYSRKEVLIANMKLPVSRNVADDFENFMLKKSS